MSNITNSSFQNNVAFEDGGSLKWLRMAPFLSNLFFGNNLAIYGENVASYPVKLKVILRDQGNEQAHL